LILLALLARLMTFKESTFFAGVPAKKIVDVADRQPHITKNVFSSKIIILYAGITRFRL
jgi:hypothetical protein